MWEKLKKRYNEWKEEQKIRNIDADAELLEKRYNNQKSLRLETSILSIVFMIGGIFFLIGFVQIIGIYTDIDNSNIEVTLLMLSMALMAIVNYLFLQHVIYVVFQKQANDNLAHISLMQKLNELEEKIEK